MSKIIRARPIAVASSVRALLAAFHEDTASKLALAPVDSSPIYERADGSLCRVDEDCWISDSDLDKLDALTIMPTSVIDTEAP